MGNRNKKKNNTGRPSTTGSNKNESNNNNSTPVNRFVSLDQSSVVPSVSSRTSRRSHGSARSRRSNASRQRRPPQQSSNDNESESVVDIFQQHMHQLEQTQQSQTPYKFTPEQKTREVIFRHDSNERHKRSVTTQIAMFLAPNTDTVDDLHDPFFKQFLQQFVLARIITDGPEEEYERYMFAVAEEEYLLYGKKNGETPALASAYAFNKFIHTTLAENVTPVITIKFLDGVQSIPYPQDSSNAKTPAQQSSVPQETIQQDKDNTPVAKSKSNEDPSDPSAPVLRPMWYQTPPQQYWSNAQVPGTCTVIPSPSSHPSQPVPSVNHYQKSPLVPPQQPVPPHVYPYQQSPSMSDHQFKTVPPSPAKNPRFPIVNTPVQLRMEALGKESFDPKTFSNSVSTLKITENNITGMQKLWARLTGAVTSAVKSPRKVFPAFNNLTQSTNLVEEMLGPAQTTAVYAKAVDNYNIISHQFHLLLTTSDIFDTCMTEARNIIKTKGLITDCGFQLLFLILQEYLPSLGATPFNVTDEINKLRIERGETLQSLYENATAIDVSLQLSQQVVPLHDLLSKFMTLLMNTKEYAAFLHYKFTDFNKFIKVYKNYPYYETLQSIYDYLKPLMSTDTPLTLIRSDNEVSTTVLESNSATHQKQPHIDARHVSNSKDKQSKEKSKQRFRHPQCRICGRRHPENQCSYLPKEYQPKVLLQNADRFLKMNPTVKPNPDWVNKTDFPPITSSFSKSTNVTEHTNIAIEEHEEDEGFYDVKPEASSVETPVKNEVGLTELEPDYFDDCVFDYYNTNTETDIEAGLTELTDVIIPEANLIELQQSDDDASTSNDSIPNLINRVRSDDSSDDEDEPVAPTVNHTAPSPPQQFFHRRYQSNPRPIVWTSPTPTENRPILWTSTTPAEIHAGSRPDLNGFQRSWPFILDGGSNPAVDIRRVGTNRVINDDESVDTADVPNLVRRVDTDDDSTDTATTTSVTLSTDSDQSHTSSSTSSSTSSRRLPVFIQLTSNNENDSIVDEQIQEENEDEEEEREEEEVEEEVEEEEEEEEVEEEEEEQEEEEEEEEEVEEEEEEEEKQKDIPWLFPIQDNGLELPTPLETEDDDASVLSMTHLAQSEHTIEHIEDNNTSDSSSDFSGMSQVSSLESLSSSSSEPHSLESQTTYQSTYTDDHRDLSVTTNNAEELHHDRTAVYNYGSDQAQALINLGHLRERYHLRHYLARMNRAHDLLRRFMDLRKFRKESHPEAWTTHDDTFIYQLLDTYFHMGFSLSPVEAQHPRYVEDLDVDLSIPHHHPTHELQERFDTLASNTERFLARNHYPYYPRLPYPDSFLRDRLADMEIRLDEFIETQNRRVSILTPDCPTVRAREFFSSPTPATIKPDTLTSEINMAESVTPLQSIIVSKHRHQQHSPTTPLPRVKLLVDTGANVNVLQQAIHLHNVVTVRDRVRQSGGTYTTTTHTGKAIIDLGSSISTDFVVVPTAPRNILSPRYLKNTHGFKKCAHDPNDSFIIVDHNDNYISIPYLPQEDPSAPTPYIYVENGLDILVTTFADLSFESNSGERPFNDAFFYHCAWNHTNVAQDVIKHQCFEGLPKHIPVLPFPCPICKAMKPRTPSPGPMIDYDKFAIGEYQAMDYTFFDKTSVRGYTSALRIVDGKTGKAHTFGTRHKRAPLTLATWFLNYLDRIGRPCKIIRTDKGGELARNTEFCKMLAERGISLQDTAGYSSHKNGKVESSHRPLKDAIRAMIMHAPPELDETFWCYAMDYSDYVSARLPRRGKSKSPYQLWHNETPKASDIHIWGCTVYECVHNPKSLDQRGHRGYFLGYANTTKNVLAYFPDTHKVRRLGKAIFDDYNVTLSPTDSIAPVTYLLRNPQPQMQLDNVVEPKVFEIESPFQDKDLHKYTVKIPRTGPLRLTVVDDDVYGIPVIQKMGKTSPFYRNLPYRFRKNAFIVSIHDDEPITSDRVYEYIEELRSRDILEFEVQLARHPTNYASEYNQLQSYFDQLRPIVNTTDKEVHTVIRTLTKPAIPTFSTLKNDPYRQYWNKSLFERFVKNMKVPVWSAPFSKSLLPPGTKVFMPVTVRNVRDTAESDVWELYTRICLNENAKQYKQERLGHEKEFGTAYVIMNSSLRFLCALAAQKHMKVGSGDVSNAFQVTPQPMDRDPVFMYSPPNFVSWFKETYPNVPVEGEAPFVVEVFTMLNGQVQAGNHFYFLASQYLKEGGYMATSFDPAVFAKAQKIEGNMHYCWVGLLTDDFIVFYSHLLLWQQLKDTLAKGLKVVYQDGPVFQFSNFRIISTEHGISIDQTAAILSSIQRFYGPEEKFVKTNIPMRTDKAFEDEMYHALPLNKEDLKKVEQQFRASYLSIFGSIINWEAGTRFDIANALNRLGVFQAAPTLIGFQGLRKILDYVRTHPNMPLFYPAGLADSTSVFHSEVFVNGVEDTLIVPHCLASHSDVSFAPFRRNRHSVQAIIISLSGVAVDWKVNNHLTCEGSATGAEIRAYYFANIRVKGLRHFAKDLGHPFSDPTPIFEDNKGSRDMINSGRVTRNLKHVDIPLCIIIEDNREGITKCVKSTTNTAASDAISKTSSGKKLALCRRFHSGTRHLPPVDSEHYQLLIHPLGTNAQGEALPPVPLLNT